MSATASSLALPSLTPKTLFLCNSKPTSFSLFSLSPSPLSLHCKPISVSASFLHCAPGFHGLPSRFVPKVAISSDFDQEEVFSDGDEVGFSPDLKLFVGNLPFSVDSAKLADLFESAGNVEMVEVIYDKTTGRSRGFGFVTMSKVEEVEAAAQQFNGYELEGRALRVNSGPPPPRREESSFRGTRGGSSWREDSSFRGTRSEPNWREDSSFRGTRSEPNWREDSSFRGTRGGPSFGAGHRVHVSNLAWGVDDLALKSLFSEQGKVVEAKVVYDRESGRSRGFGFVTYNSEAEVNNAIESLNGVDLNGRALRVSPAEAKPRRQF